MSTRNSPHASRSSSSRSASRSMKARTMPATSTSRRSSSSLSTSVSSRSNGPSNASRSSSSSRTITRRTVAALPDAALGHGHRRPLSASAAARASARLGFDGFAKNCHQTKNATERDEDDERDPEVDPLAERSGSTGRSAASPRRCGTPCRWRRRARRAPGRLIVKRRSIQSSDDARRGGPRGTRRGRSGGTGVAVRRLAVDLERPRQRRVLAVELLVPVVAPAADRPARAGGPARPRPSSAATLLPERWTTQRADEHAERDRAPDPEPARPDGERPVPVRVDRRVLVPAGDQSW